MEESKSDRWIFGLCAGLIVLFPLYHGASAQGQAASDDNAIAMGKKTYFQKGCHYCHGNVGQGSSSGKRIAEPVLPLPSFSGIVRKPYGIMPAYSPDVLSDVELENIHKYLGAQKSPDSKDIPILKPSGN